MTRTIARDYEAFGIMPDSKTESNKTPPKNVSRMETDEMIRALDQMVRDALITEMIRELIILKQNGESGFDFY